MGTKLIIKDADFTAIDFDLDTTKTLVSIAVTTPPTKTSYTTDDYFNPAGMVVTATYDDSSTEVITNYTYSPTTKLTTSVTAITISYRGKTTTTPITVTQSTKTLVSIEATYTQGQTAVYPDTSLDSLKTNLVVVATYNDTSTQTLPANAYTLSGTLAVGTSTITATYNGKTDTFSVVVVERPTLVSLTHTGTLVKTSYNQGDAFDPTGLTFTATYSNSSTQTVNPTFSPATLSLGDTQVTASYTENGITQTDVITGITVTQAVVPSEDTVITDATREKTNYIFEPNTVAVGGTLNDATSYISITAPAYNIDSYPVEYTDAYYSIVGRTNWGAGRADKYDGYNIEAVVLDDLGEIVGVTTAHQKNSQPIANDTFYIDMSQYTNPTELWICHNNPVTLTALADTPSET